MTPNLQSAQFHAASAGDAKAFAALIDSTRNLVCSIALATVGDVHVSEEVAQDVYLAAWRGLSTVRNPDSFLPWLRQLTRNHAIEYLRRFGRREKKHVLDEGALATVADPGGQPLDTLVSREEQARLAEAIDRLPDEAREVVILYYREGQSVAQVAALLGMQEPAIKQRLSRAREALRRSLDEAGEALGRTAPAAAFTAATTALILAAPSTSAAASISVGKSLGAVSGWAKVAAGLGSAAPGALLGGASLFFTRIWALKAAKDEQERRSVNRFFAVQALAWTAFMGTATYASQQPRLPSALVAVSWAVTALTVALSYLVWMPRITARRLAAPRDPVSQARLRRGAFLNLVAVLVGLGIGTASIAYVMMNRGSPAP